MGTAIDQWNQVKRPPDAQSKLGLTDAALWGAVQEMGAGLVELAKELLAFEDRQLEIALFAGEIVEINTGKDKA